MLARIGRLLFWLSIVLSLGWVGWFASIVADGRVQVGRFEFAAFVSIPATFVVLLGWALRSLLAGESR
jgi:hypothetical protein